MPSERRYPAIAWHRGDVLLKRKPPVSVSSAVYSAVAASREIVQPATIARSNTSSPVAHAVVSENTVGPGGSSPGT